MSLLESKVDHQCFMTPSITYTCHRCAPNITVFPLASTVSAMGKQRPPSWFGTMTVKKKKVFYTVVVVVVYLRLAAVITPSLLKLYER